MAPAITPVPAPWSTVRRHTPLRPPDAPVPCPPRHGRPCHQPPAPAPPRRGASDEAGYGGGLGRHGGSLLALADFGQLPPGPVLESRRVGKSPSVRLI